MPYQQSTANAMAPPGQQSCPEMCVHWDTVLKENGRLENTPVVTSPMAPGDTITECPKQCEPRCCNTARQSFVPSGQPLSSDGLQNDHPPACMEGCPKACYPACRPGCCNAPRMMSMYQQSMVQQSAMMREPMSQSYVQQYASPGSDTLTNPATPSLLSQGTVAEYLFKI